MLAAMPWPAPSRPRLPLPYLLLALALHALLLLNLPAPRTAPNEPSQPLQVRWRRPPVLPPALVSPPAKLAATSNQPAQRWQQSSDAPAVPATPARAPTLPATEPPPSSGHLLLDQARTQIRQEGRLQSAYRQAHMPGFLATPNHETQSALGRALQKAAPGEKHLANGIIQITTEAGTTYCLQAANDLRQRDTPMALTAVPTTCP
jgi:hypothetical protein